MFASLRYLSDTELSLDLKFLGNCFMNCELITALTKLLLNSTAKFFTGGTYS